jgi:methyl-accepting chemotaxis protein
MKVVNRIALGYGLIVSMLLLLVLSQIFGIRKLQTIGKVNAGGHFEAAITALQLIRDRDAVEESAGKFLTAPDPAIDAQFESSREAFEVGLRRLSSESLSERERTEISRLASFWRGFLAFVTAARHAALTGEAKDITAELNQNIELLRAQTFTVYEVALKAMEAEVESAQRIGDRIQSVLGFVAGAFLVLGAFVGLVIHRSVAVPLRALAEGTRAMAEGNAYYRLDTSRADEFSQIAKDFNELRKLQPGTRPSVGATPPG